MGNEFDKILKIIQGEIPLVKRPFLVLAKELGLKETEFLKVIEKLIENSIVRQIAPIYDSKMLGYDSALVAFRVDKERLERVANFINSCPGVSHNYERTHDFNLWFTLAVFPDALSLEDIVKLMAERTQTQDYVVLRTVRMFKIGVKLDYESTLERESFSVNTYTYVPLSDEEKKIVSVTQGSIPLTERPFFEYAKKLSISEEDLLTKLREFKERGILRRISAILHHRRAGFVANAMSVWKVPEDSVEEVGSYIASFKGVSHCYERTTNESWKYNLFAMIHGKSVEDVQRLVERISEEKALRDYALLFSTREFKKERIRYFSEDFDEWLRKITSI